MITKKMPPPSYGALVPAKYLPQGVPEGLVEIGLGALLGYLIGNMKKQPAIGALIGGIVGGIAGQLKLPGTQLKNTYIAPAAPGISQPGSKPGQSGFDVGAAGAIIDNIAKNEGFTSLLKSAAAAINKAWGPSAQTTPAGQTFERPVSMADEGGVSAPAMTAPVEDSVVISSTEGWFTDETAGDTGCDPTTQSCA